MTADLPIDMNPEVPHPARMYDLLLGGTSGFDSDRAALARVGEAVGGIDFCRADARSNRDFLARAVRAMATAGVNQFFDIGTGIPNAIDDTHTLAMSLVPDARVVSVDNDPVVLAHSHHLVRALEGGAAGFVWGDLRDPRHLLAAAGDLLDLREPVGLLLVAILHLLTDDEHPADLVAQLVDALAPGSYLTITHLSDDLAPTGLIEALNKTKGRDPFTARSAAELAPFLSGLELLEPGLVAVHEWRPDPDRDAPLPAGRRPSFYGAVAHKRRTP